MKRILTLLTLSTLALTSCSKDDNETLTTTTGETTITFDAKVGTEDFSLNRQFTINGTVYSFTQLRYWVSNISLTNDKGETYKVSGGYYLLEENNAIAVQDGDFQYPARKREDVVLKDVPAGTYNKLSFAVGVDSTYNNNLSLQAGELSQLNGMTIISWMWHTSYIFSSLKGVLAETSSPVNITVETGLNTNYRTVNIDLTTALTVSAGANSSVKLTTDVAKVIDGVDIKATPSIGAAQPTVMKQVADNFGVKAITLASVSSK